MTIKHFKIWLLPLFVIYLNGCSSLTDSSGNNIIVNAAKDPFTWGNLLAAGAVVPFDKKISSYMVKHKPLFNDNASDLSNQFRSYTNWSMQLSSLSVASDYKNNFTDTVILKSERLLRDNLSSGLVAMSTTKIQDLTKRTRPGGNCCGFPSAHTSRAFSTAFFARKNYEHSVFNNTVNDSLIFLTYLSAYSTGIARIEAGAHYPSDVFVGAAFGNFLASILYQYTNNYIPALSPSIELGKDQFYLGFRYQFQ